MAIMNVSDSPANITVTLKGSASPPTSGATYTQTFLGVAPFHSVIASPYASTVGGFPAGGLGVATLTSTGPILVEASEGNEVSASGYACSSFQDNFPDA